MPQARGSTARCHLFIRGEGWEEAQGRIQQASHSSPSEQMKKPVKPVLHPSNTFSCVIVSSVFVSSLFLLFSCDAEKNGVSSITVQSRVTISQEVGYL